MFNSQPFHVSGEGCILMHLISVRPLHQLYGKGHAIVQPIIWNMLCIYFLSNQGTEMLRKLYSAPKMVDPILQIKCYWICCSFISLQYLSTVQPSPCTTHVVSIGLPRWRPKRTHVFDKEVKKGRTSAFIDKPQSNLDSFLWRDVTKLCICLFRQQNNNLTLSKHGHRGPIMLWSFSAATGTLKEWWNQKINQDIWQ